MITLEVGRKTFSNFTSAEATLNLDALCNTFSFTAVTADAAPMPFAVGDPCRVRVDGSLVITGTIEDISRSYGSNSDNFSVSGRDRTSDLVDSSLDSIGEIESTISLKGIIEQVLKSIGSSVKVSSKSIDTENFDQGVVRQSPEPGQNAFDFLYEMSRQQQVLLSSDGDGDVLITRAQPVELTKIRLQNLIDSPNNNILKGSVKYSITKRFNTYKTFSSLNATAAAKSKEGLPPDSIVNQNAIVIDTAVPQGRKMVFKTEDNYGFKKIADRSLWEANIRKARSIKFDVTVQDHRLGGFLWDINHTIKINDVFAGINSDMLINTVTFKTDIGSGNTTDLSFIDKKAYTLTLDDPKLDKKGIIFKPA